VSFVIGAYVWCLNGYRGVPQSEAGTTIALRLLIVLDKLIVNISSALTSTMSGANSASF
jgi:hypothetical protein